MYNWLLFNPIARWAAQIGVFLRARQVDVIFNDAEAKSMRD